MTPLIGMTEAGDAGWDLSWYDKLLSGKYAGAILITKSADREPFQQKVMELYHQGFPFIIHAGVTGWGGTAMEPNVQPPETVLRAIKSLLDNGFPAERVVLRVDPIYPTKEGIARAVNTIRLAKNIVPEIKRIRISIYDDYHKAREEIINRGLCPIDNCTKWKNEEERRPSVQQINSVALALALACPDQAFECCAEPEISQSFPKRFKWFGCLSEKDCELMGIQVPDNIGINNQQRFGCRCLKMKTELLNNKRRCPNNCAYCYWGKP